MNLSLLHFAGKEERGSLMSENNILLFRKGQAPRQIVAEAHSILGNRKSQQDFAGILTYPDRILAVLCDGMGGLRGGERASRAAATMLLEDYDRKRPVEGVMDFLCAEAVRMDARVHGLTTEDGKRLDAGTTMIAAIVGTDGRTEWISVGDSRIYLLRKGVLSQLTRDHNYRSYLEDALRKGTITQAHYDQEINSRMVEALTSYLGSGNLTQIDRCRTQLQLEPGDQLLLSSDGLYKSLSPQQIKAMLTDNQIDARVSAKRLVYMALEQAVKKQDNTTVVLIQYRGRKTEEQ